MKEPIKKIIVSKDGPYLVSGNLPIAKETIVADKGGFSEKWEKGQSYPKKETCSLCRCGSSCSKPYCDGSHTNICFDGTENSSKKKYIEEAEKTKGGQIDLTDNFKLCSRARFCERGKGIWDLTGESDKEESKKMAIGQACDCPSGRLVVWDKKTGKPIEPEFEKSISLVEDPAMNCSGPLWVKGGVSIQSCTGKEYEIRNRVTLCRCGKSKNKPFCDGTHISVGFKA